MKSCGGERHREDKSMERFVTVFLGIIFVVGVIRIAVFLHGRTPLLMDPGQTVGKRSHAILGFFTSYSQCGLRYAEVQDRGSGKYLDRCGFGGTSL